MAHRQTIDFWEQGEECTVKVDTVKNIKYKNEKNENIKRERTHSDINGGLKKVKASLAAALMNAEAEHAAHLVKGSFMEQKFALEAKQLAIKRKLEVLELETKIAEVTAKLAVLNASKTQKSAKSRSAHEKPKLKPQPVDTQASHSFSGLVDDDDGFNEVDWEGPEIYVPVVVAGADTGAGDTIKVPPSHEETSEVHLSVDSEPQQDIKVLDVVLEDTSSSTLDCKNGFQSNPLPVKVVAASSKEPKKTIILVAEEEGSDDPVCERPLQRLVGSGLSKDTLLIDNSCVAKDNLVEVVAVIPQTLEEPIFVNGVSMNSEKCTVGLMMFVLFLIVVQVYKLFQLKQYKTFKRKRWKIIY